MPPHVLLLIDSYVTDRDPRHGAKFRLQLKAYKERGFKVGLVAFMQRDYRLSDCLKRGALMWEDEDLEVPIVRNCDFHALTSKLPRIRNMPVATRRLGPRSLKYYIQRHGRPDIIHAHGSQWCGYAASVVFKSLGIPYVLTEHMSNYARETVKAEHLPFMREAFTHARMCLPISESTGKVLEKIFGNDVQPWTAVPNMVDVSLFASAALKTLPDAEPFNFFTVGRHDHVKGYDILLKAFAQKFKGDKVHLRIGGGGLLSQELKLLSQSLGLDGQVEFLGRLERHQVADEMRRANAYVLSSHYETFGIPILEAHASGVPVVATAAGGPQQLIDESNGFLVEPKNVDALAQGMDLMISHYKEFDRVIIRERCLAEYSPDVILDRLEAIYDSALDLENL